MGEDEVRSPRYKRVGNTNEAVVVLGWVECLALIDAGSIITYLGETFYHTSNCLEKQHPLQDLD